MLEEIHKAGCNAAACHAQMYIMGTVLRHGNKEQKERYLPKIATGELRLQAFGVTEPSSGTDTLSLRTTAVKKDNSTYVVNGQKVWTSRAEHSDLMLLLARTTPREQTQKKTEGLSVFLVDMRDGAGQGPHHPADPHDDEPQQHRSVLRQHGSVGREPHRRGGQGFRYILSGMNAERVLIASECIGDGTLVHRAGGELRQGAQAVRPPDRPEPGRPVSDRARLHRRSRRPT